MEFLITIIIIIAIIIWYRNRHKNDIPKSSHQSDYVSDSEKSKYNLYGYIKKQFIFDTASEFHFLPLLQNILGSDYYIFPQINYSHLIQSKTGSFYEDRRYRSHIERRSADFVVCDKKTCIPRLVIDLDGGVHNRSDIHDKDIEINEILDAIGLPILRISNGNSKNRELVKSKVEVLLKQH